MSTVNQDELLKQIYGRLDTITNAQVSREQIATMVREELAGLENDGEWLRKMRFGTTADSRLMGSKFYRFGMSLSDIEYAYDLMQSMAVVTNGRHPGPSEELRNAFSAISEAHYMSQERVREIDKRAIENEFPRIPLSALTPADRALFGRGARVAGDGPYEQTMAYQAAVRAMDTAESGYGSQLIGAQYVQDLWEASRMQSRVLGLMNTFEMLDPVAYLPVEADIPEMLFVGESTANNSSNYGTSKTGSNRVQVNARKFVIHQMWSGEMEEDSLIPFVPYLRRQVTYSLGHYGDSVVLNGDTTNADTGNINSDDANPDDTKHYLAFDGILHAALVDATDALDNVAGALTFAHLANVPGRMVDETYLMDWGHPTRPEDLVYVADPTTADKIALLDEMLNWKIQQGRALMSLPGQVGEILNHPVIASIAMKKAEADGKVSATASNNTLGRVAAFNRRFCVVGWRRRVKMMVEQLPATDQVRMVHSLRMGFGRFSPTGAASGIKGARVLYNIDLS